jgi:hypothetical protein
MLKPTITRLIFSLAISTGAFAGDKPNVDPLFVASGWDKGWVRASGVWVRQGGEEVGAGRAIDLNCYRSLRICIEATASLNRGTLASNTVLYDIESWSRGQVRTKPAPEVCGSFVIVISRRPPRVSAEFTNNSRSDSICTTPGLIEHMQMNVPMLAM